MSEHVHLPSLAGATEWLNTEPLGPAELRGHVVLVNFWTLTCINWLRQEPHVRAWSHAYRDDGLIVIGVHTPEFSFEHGIGHVRRAVKERRIDYPVALDSSYAIWSAFGNHYWPALYFADADGIIRDQHFGEGRYEQSERVIQQLLGIDREPVAVEGHGVEAPADWNDLRTPETYLGNDRGERFASPGGATFERRSYELPERLGLNDWALAGEWTMGQEKVVLGPADAPIPFLVRLDGEAPGASHGADVDEDGKALLRDGRLYQLVRQRGPIRERTLEIMFRVPGVQAYVFTFG
jgi:thiol-disulfide isomerase/thioredoxin